MTGAENERAGTVAVFDLDGTVTIGDTFVAFLVRFMRRYPSAMLRASWLPLAVGMHAVGARDNTWLKRTFLRTIAAGAARSDVDAVAEGLVSQIMRQSLRPEAQSAIAEHRRLGHRLILATASLDVYVEPLAGLLGFDDVVCTRVAWDERDRLTGGLDGGNCYGERKREAVARLLGTRADKWLVSYSDHESDLPLLAWSDRAAVVNPRDTFKARALRRGFDVLSW